MNLPSVHVNDEGLPPTLPDHVNQLRDVSLAELLRLVARTGWNSPAGAEAVRAMQRACRREAARWTWTAGWMTDEGLADTWEQMDRLMRSGRFDDAPGLLAKVVRRAYAGEAAASQTGMGSASTRGLVTAVAQSQVALITELSEDEERAPEQLESMPHWMRVLGAVLAAEGWQWPVPALDAVMASAATVARSGRNSRSVMAGHQTGVPAATWSALDLLIFGSGPGCDASTRVPGVAVQIDLLGAAGLRSNPSLLRIVRAAVHGRPVRTGRSLGKAS